MSSDTGEQAPDSNEAPSEKLQVTMYQWVVMGVTLIGTFAVVLDTTIVNIGLPALQREFGSPDRVEWVVTAYLAAVGVGQMCTGWLTDRFGYKRCFIGAFTLFTIASALCAAAPDLPLLIGARVLQGVGGGLLMPVAMSMIYMLFPAADRGRALGLFGIAIMAAPAIGPVLGGTVVSSIGWRWLFLINIPVGVIGVPLAIMMLRNDEGDPNRRLDTLGLVLATAGLSLVMVGFAEGQQQWSSPVTIACLAVGVAVLVWFVRHSLAAPVPLVDLRIFANPVFALAMVILGLMAVGQYTRLIYIPLELANVRGLAENRIGYVMLPSALGMAITMPIGGRLVDRIGARLPITLGCSVFALSFLGLASVTATTPYIVYAAWLGLGGLGGGLAMMAPNIQALNSIKTSLVSQATGLSSVTRQIAAAIGVAVLTSIFVSTSRTSEGGATGLASYRLMYLIAAALFVVCAVLARFLPDRSEAKALQDARAAEAEETALIAVEVG